MKCQSDEMVVITIGYDGIIEGGGINWPEGSEMSLCLGAKSLVQGPLNMAPETLGRMRSAKGKRPWAGQENPNRATGSSISA